MAKPITNKVKTGQIPVIKKELDDGVIAEANNDGTIYLDKSVKNDSPLAKEAIAHEMVHMDQMSRGDLNYNDDKVFWKGKEYDRDDMNEGSKNLPWEKEAYNKTKNMKKSPNKYTLGGGAINTNKHVLMTKLRAEADKTAAIGNAVGQVTSKIPSFDEYEDTKDKKKDPEAVDLVEDPAPKMKANPITMKAKSSPLHAETTETKEFDATVEGKQGKVKETATTTKDKKESVKNFATACYNEDGSKKAEGTVVDGILCSWAKDEDFDPESEYKEETIYDSAFTPETEEIKKPGGPGKANLGYYEALDTKMGAGVTGRGKRREMRKRKGAGNKYDRMSSRGNTPVGADGKPMTREDYIKERAGAYAMPDAFVGKRGPGTEGSVETVDKTGDTTHKYNPDTKRYEPIKMSKNKNKSAFKMKGWNAY